MVKLSKLPIKYYFIGNYGSKVYRVQSKDAYKAYLKIRTKRGREIDNKKLNHLTSFESLSDVTTYQDNLIGDLDIID